MEYKEITREDFEALLTKLMNGTLTYFDTGNYLIIHYNQKGNSVLYTAIDNTTNNLWTEDFDTFEEAIDYLEGDYVP